MEDMIRRLANLSTVDLHVPSSYIGSELKGSNKDMYERLKREFLLFIEKERNGRTRKVATFAEVSAISDIVCQAINQKRMAVLISFFSLMRVYFLSHDPEVISRTVLIVDYLVKNDGHWVHLLVAKGSFLKTMSKAARREISCFSETEHVEAGTLLLG